MRFLLGALVGVALTLTASEQFPELKALTTHYLERFAQDPGETGPLAEAEKTPTNALTKAPTRALAAVPDSPDSDKQSPWLEDAIPSATSLLELRPPARVTPARVTPARVTPAPIEPVEVKPSANSQPLLDDDSGSQQEQDLPNEILAETIVPIHPLTETGAQRATIWTPFHSEGSAKGFAGMLTRELGLDFQVDRESPGRYQVTFAYGDETERDLISDQVTAITGWARVEP